MILILCITITIFFLPLSSVSAEEVPPAYRAIAAEYSIPPVLLYSVAMTESGSSINGIKRPWPWAVNHKGEGIYFTSRTEAYNYVSRLLESGHTSFDIGLMQVNWRWNKHVFKSLWDAFDPYTNLRGGAHIIQAHYRKLGNYEAAVGAYHSPGDPVRASTYRENVRHNLSKVIGGAHQVRQF